MNAAAEWMQAHVVRSDNARYLGAVANALILIVALWYIAQRLAAGASSGHALLVGGSLPNAS